VQLDLPFLKSRHPAPPAPVPEVPARPAVSDGVAFVRVRRARRYILRVQPDGTLRVTIPRGGSRAEAEAFVGRQLDWVARERARTRRERAPARWGHGSALLLDGVPHTIEVREAEGAAFAEYAGRVVKLRDVDDVRPEVERDLRRLAVERLVPRLHALAAAHGLTVRRVTIRNQRSRWGSCSRSGAIALNFRLVQMPPAVCDYVLIHELMHLRQQNHGPRFWALVERACPGYRDAERWLRRVGRSLF
jgi:predicted metal-dependent hydrolase